MVYRSYFSKSRHKNVEKILQKTIYILIPLCYNASKVINSMDRHHELPAEKQTPELPPCIIDYSGLIDVVQLSVARELDLPGAIGVPQVTKDKEIIKNEGAKSFAQLIEPLDEKTRTEYICEVGQRFDNTLVNFVSAALIRHQKHGIVILAEEDDGIDGFLPWEDKLSRRIDTLKERGTFDPRAFVRVERYKSSEKDRVEEAYRKLGSQALVTTAAVSTV
jgi:hypothetical protein